MNILEKLYYGNIRPDVKFYSKDSPFVKLARLCEKNRENLLEHLSEKEKETFVSDLCQKEPNTDTIKHIKKLLKENESVIS